MLSIISVVLSFARLLRRVLWSTCRRDRVAFTGLWDLFDLRATIMYDDLTLAKLRPGLLARSCGDPEHYQSDYVARAAHGRIDDPLDSAGQEQDAHDAPVPPRAPLNGGRGRVSPAGWWSRLADAGGAHS
ncbi:hypothetical protein MKSMC1_25940 [Mycobacterium kansasii]|nr:hypothetical protein MKSMC1_25940 [Mycobacterium kansasii]